MSKGFTNQAATVCILCLFVSAATFADDEDAESADLVRAEDVSQKDAAPPTAIETESRRQDEAALNEDPEAQRRSISQIEAKVSDMVSPDGAVAAPPEKKSTLDFYSSVRVHAINTFGIDGIRSNEISDGNSRMGIRGDWQFKPGWWLMGRYEAGFDIVQNFSTRGDGDGDGGLTQRLTFAGFDSDHLTLVYGKNWSAYYKVAGMTDRFAIFGGSASGVYNAGTVGDATGTGRADDVIQARVYIDKERWTPHLKPFNLNLQYQFSQPIPQVDGEEFEYGISASAILETEKEYSVGLAYNRSVVQNPMSAALKEAGIDGDAEAFAIATRAYGDRWYASILYSRLVNMEVTDKGKYVDVQGLEVYAQWEFRSKWWLIGGTNWLKPVDDDPDAGEFETFYYVLGGRYSFESFNRMLYLEYRIDQSRTFDGARGKDEITIGVRWDFGH